MRLKRICKSITCIVMSAGFVFTGFTIDLDAADVNADGKVDTRDAVKILKKIAGFDVTLGEA